MLCDRRHVDGVLHNQRRLPLHIANKKDRHIVSFAATVAFMQSIAPDRETAHSFCIPWPSLMHLRSRWRSLVHLHEELTSNRRDEIHEELHPIGVTPLLKVR